MRAQKLDFVLVGPSEYVVFQSRVKLVPVIEFTRPDYFSAIVVRRDSHINTLADLKGARIAFNDVGSTSGHIGPSILFKEAGIDPVKDIQPLYLSSPVGYAGMKRGDVRAWATSQDIYRRLRDADKESQTGDFKVIAHGPDLPNDVVIARADLDPALVTKFRAAFADPATAKILKAALSFTPDGEDHYKLSKFLTDVNDSDYDYIREGYIAIGQSQFAKPTE
jgi:phosphonate transport system substrate-binding protein